MGPMLSNRPRPRAVPASRVVKQRHEAVVHVKLHVAVKGPPGIVRGEVDLDFLVAAEYHHGLEHAEGKAGMAPVATVRPLRLKSVR